MLPRHPHRSRMTFPIWQFLFPLVITAMFVPFVQAQEAGWERYSAENFTLGPKEAIQLRVLYDQIPVRAFKLVVDGGDEKCDLTVLRVQGEELLYFKTGESRHEVEVPWGEGEEVILAITNRDVKSGFVVELMGIVLWLMDMVLLWAIRLLTGQGG